MNTITRIDQKIKSEYIRTYVLHLEFQLTNKNYNICNGYQHWQNKNKYIMIIPYEKMKKKNEQLNNPKNS